MKHPTNNSDDKPSYNIIRKYSDKSLSDPFLSRMLWQVARIRDQVLPLAEREKFSKAYHPIFTNLGACRDAKDEICDLWNGYVDLLQRGENVRFEDRTIHVDEIIDKKLNRLVGEFYIRGRAALDNFEKLQEFMGFNLTRFLKGDEDFNKARDNFLERKSGEEREWFTKVLDLIKSDRVSWLTEFVKLRNLIVHHGWELPQIQLVPVQAGSKVALEPLHPEINGKRLDQTINSHWIGLVHFCEDMAVSVALHRYIRYPMYLVVIPEQNRNPDDPFRYMIDVHIK
jgi:hypothetical protein